MKRKIWAFLLICLIILVTFMFFTSTFRRGVGDWTYFTQPQTGDNYSYYEAYTYPIQRSSSPLLKLSYYCVPSKGYKLYLDMEILGEGDFFKVKQKYTIEAQVDEIEPFNITGIALKKDELFFTSSPTERKLATLLSSGNKLDIIIRRSEGPSNLALDFSLKGAKESIMAVNQYCNLNVLPSMHTK